jgi:hypothetical protein
MNDDYDFKSNLCLCLMVDGLRAFRRRRRRLFGAAE